MTEFKKFHRVLTYALFVAANAVFAQDCQKLYQQARTFYDEKKAEKVIALIEKSKSCWEAGADSVRWKWVMLTADTHFFIKDDSKTALQFYSRALPLAHVSGRLADICQNYRALANTHRYLENWDSSAHYYQKALRIYAEGLVSKSTTTYARMLYRFAQVELEREQYGLAKQLSAEARPLFDSLKVADDDRFDLMDVQVSALLELEEYAQATRVLVEQVALLSKMCGTPKADQEDCAANFQNIGVNYVNAAEYQKGLEAYETAIRLYKSIKKPDKEGLAQCYGSKGTCYRELGDFANAQRELTEALRYAEELKDAGTLSDVRFKLAELYIAKGDFEKAEREAQLSLQALTPELLNSDEVAGIYEQLARIAAGRRDEVSQEKYLNLYKQNAIAYHRNGDSHGLACRSLGSSYHASGQFVKAEQELRESCEIYRKLYPQGMNYESSLESLAHLYRDMGRFDQADSLYSMCIELYEFNQELGIDYSNLYYLIAILNESRGNYQLALENIHLHTSLVQKLEGRGLNYADAQDKQGGIYYSMGDYKKAERFYLRALQLYDSLGATTNRIEALRSAGVFYINWGKKGEALRHAKAAVNLARDTQASKLSQALGWHNLGYVYQSLNQTDSAMNLFRQVLPVYREFSGYKSDSYARILSALALGHQARGQLDSAEFLLKQRVDIYRSINPRGVDVADAQVTLASFYNKAGRIGEAESLYRTALKQKEELSGETTSLASSLGSFGWFLIQTGQYRDAEVQIKRAMTILEKMGNEETDSYTGRLTELGSLYQETGALVKSERVKRQALELEAKLSGNGSPDYAIQVNNLGVWYAATYQYQRAFESYQQAALIAKNVFGVESERYAFYLSNVAWACRSLKQYDRADSLYQVVGAIRKNYFGPQHPQTLDVVNSRAFLDKARGNYFRSREGYEQVLKSRKEIFGEANINYWRAQQAVADLDLKMGRYDQSLPVLVRLRDDYKMQLGEFHPTLASVNKMLATGYLQRAKSAEAYSYFNDLLKVRYFQIDKTFSALTEREREEYYNGMREDIGLFASYALIGAGAMPFNGKFEKVPRLSLLGELYDHQLATKAILLNSTARLRRQIISGSDKVLKEKFFEWEKLKSQLASLYQRNVAENQNTTGTEASKSVRDSLEARIDKLERELSSKSERFARQDDKKKYSWKDIQVKLNPGEAVIEIVRIQKFGNAGWITDKSDPKQLRYPRYDLTDTVVYACLMLTPETKTGPQLIVLPEGNSLERNYLKHYQNSIYQRSRDTESYDRYWHAIANHPLIVGKVKKLFISPDGVYNQISINSLLNPKTGRYVIDEVDVELVTNSKDIVLARQTNDQNNYAVFIGNPAFYTTQSAKVIKATTKSTSLVRGGTLTNLPGAETEVKKITEMIDSLSIGWEQDVLFGKAATEARIKGMENPKVLHVATHGFFEQSRGAAGTRGAEVEIVESAEGERPGSRLNPMLASGLFLQGGGDALSALKAFDYELLDREDGILTAYEAMNLNIENTELIVLSACETGLGEVSNGEGVYGLQRALKVAGAKAVVMSLWSVSDDATMVLMKDFYKSWLTHSDKKEAFRNAQLKVRGMSQFSHPFFWAAFVMVGD